METEAPQQQSKAQELNPAGLINIGRSVGIPKLYYESRFSNFITKTSDSDRFYSKFVAYATISPLPALYVFGSTGCGKTHLCCSLLWSFIELGYIKNSAGGMFLSSCDLLIELRSGITRKIPEADIVSRYCKPGLLVLDGLESMHHTDWSREAIAAILDYRIREIKPTIVSSNLTIEQCSECLSPAIASRLGAGVVLMNPGSDERKKKRYLNGTAPGDSPKPTTLNI